MEEKEKNAVNGITSLMRFNNSLCAFSKVVWNISSARAKTKKSGVINSYQSQVIYVRCAKIVRISTKTNQFISTRKSSLLTHHSEAAHVLFVVSLGVRARESFRVAR